MLWSGSQNAENLTSYAFDFPLSLIAQKTAGKGKTKILLCPKNGGDLQILESSQITDLFNAGDCIVVNNTQVIPARLFGKTRHGGKAEILLIKQLEAAPDGSARWEAWVKPGKAFENGKEILISKTKCVADVRSCSGDNSKTRIINFAIPNAEFNSFLAENGHIPLPPYINRSDFQSDKNDYQAVFAKNAGAVAAPTASLHFSEDMVNKLKAKGVFFAETTLHIGPGTFESIKEIEDFRKHKMHSEEYEITETAANTINEAKKNGGRIICIGTTSTRVIETASDEKGVKAAKGTTSLFIYPGIEFKATDALLTNFHWPKSSLILLVAAFYGRENTLNAYKYAVENSMKLFSYGDGMLVI
jgi:S-adenosylmethionine:tRNA ribosyltransferase-isomerase